MVELENIFFSYGEKRVFENFSLTVNDGERVMLFGPSGCGKSTLLRIISGLEAAEGKAGITGKISAVFQENRLLPRKSALYNAALAGNRGKAEKFLVSLGLSDFLSARADSLSGGQARRVSLARALAADYDILLLDEPFSGLDADSKALAARLINEETKGKTVILVSHEKKDAELIGARVEILHDM